MYMVCINIIIFRHFELEIALAIPAPNEWKKVRYNFRQHEGNVSFMPQPSSDCAGSSFIGIWKLTWKCYEIFAAIIEYPSCRLINSFIRLFSFSKNTFAI